MALYSIGTWDGELQAYTPQAGAPDSINVPLPGLLRCLRALRRMGYSAHRFRDSNGERDNNDYYVLVERTDGMPLEQILKQWER